MSAAADTSELASCATSPALALKFFWPGSGRLLGLKNQHPLHRHTIRADHQPRHHALGRHNPAPSGKPNRADIPLDMIEHAIHLSAIKVDEVYRSTACNYAPAVGVSFRSPVNG